MSARTSLLSNLIKWCNNEFYFHKEQLIDVIQALKARKIVDRSGSTYWIMRTALKPYMRLELCANRWNIHKQAGFISIKWEESNSVYICDIQIYEQFQGVGLGSCLLIEAINYARGRGAIEIHGIVAWDDLYRTPFLLDWYESKGFTVQRHSRESGNHAAHIQMKLRHESKDMHTPR